MRVEKLGNNLITLLIAVSMTIVSSTSVQALRRVREMVRPWEKERILEEVKKFPEQPMIKVLEKKIKLLEKDPPKDPKGIYFGIADKLEYIATTLRITSQFQTKKQKDIALKYINKLIEKGDEDAKFKTGKYYEGNPVTAALTDDEKIKLKDIKTKIERAEIAAPPRKPPKKPRRRPVEEIALEEVEEIDIKDIREKLLNATTFVRGVDIIIGILADPEKAEQCRKRDIWRLFTSAARRILSKKDPLKLKDDEAKMDTAEKLFQAGIDVTPQEKKDRVKFDKGQTFSYRLRFGRKSDFDKLTEWLYKLKALRLEPPGVQLTTIKQMRKDLGSAETFKFAVNAIIQILTDPAKAIRYNKKDIWGLFTSAARKLFPRRIFWRRRLKLDKEGRENAITLFRAGMKAAPKEKKGRVKFKRGQTFSYTSTPFSTSNYDRCRRWLAKAQKLKPVL
jgi:hypothetical protein